MPELVPPPEGRTAEYEWLSESDSVQDRPNGTVSGSIGAIVQNFKATAARAINVQRKTAGAGIWQRNYYEHIVRDHADLDSILAYIRGKSGKLEQRSGKPG